MGEAAAEGYLRKKGYEILARNYHIPGGEIDIIAADKEYIIFAEVKTRNASSKKEKSRSRNDFGININKTIFLSPFFLQLMRNTVFINNRNNTFNRNIDFWVSGVFMTP